MDKKEKKSKHDKKEKLKKKDKEKVAGKSEEEAVAQRRSFIHRQAQLLSLALTRPLAYLLDHRDFPRLLYCTLKS